MHCPCIMHFMKTCRLVGGNINGRSSLLAVSNHFASAFDPGCKIWPILRSVGAWEITVIHENIDRIIIGKPRKVGINPGK